ncbi:MAG TPA: universal stress protein [Jatrophihabitans sp.]|nr:universal stress protein [Jatrophihabitans sp.]
MTTALTPILVGVDNSAASDEAVRFAVREGKLRGLPVELVHSTHYLYLPSRYGEAPLPASRELNEYSQRSLAEAERAAAQADPTVPVTVSVHDGDPIQYLLHRSTSAAAIVLGTHRMPTFWGALVRSIGQSVAAHAHCPVFLINHDQQAPRSDTPFVIVGVSPSAGGRQALRFGFEEARERGIGLTAVRCAAPIAWSSATAMGYGPYIYTDWDKTENAIMDESMAGIAEEYPDVKVNRAVLNQSPTMALISLAAGADLLVVGAHRRDEHWLSRLGPVASWLLHNAPCPLAVVGRSGAEATVAPGARAGAAAG